MSTTKQDNKNVTALMIERGEHPHETVQLTPEEEEATGKPMSPCGGTCINTWRSYLSRNAALSVLTINGFVCLLVLNGFFSCFSVNAAFSVFSVNSILSIASVNSMLSVGCAGGWMEICGPFSVDATD